MEVPSSLQSHQHIGGEQDIGTYLARVSWRATNVAIVIWRTKQEFDVRVWVTRLGEAKAYRSLLC